MAPNGNYGMCKKLANNVVLPVYRINMLALARCPDEIGSEGFFSPLDDPETNWH